MKNVIMDWAVFENDKCTNVIVATQSVIDDFSQRYPDRVYIVAYACGICEGDRLAIDDWRERQEDGSYKYFRNEIVGVNEQGEFIYVTRELIYLSE